MPVVIEIADRRADEDLFKELFSYLDSVDSKFSTYKETSEINRFNRGELTNKELSDDLKEIFRLSEMYRIMTSGYFDIRRPTGGIDPSGIVKGWAINNLFLSLKKRGFRNFYIDCGGDLGISGLSALGKPWRVGIRHPREKDKIVKKISVVNGGVATSGTYERGTHIYNPLSGKSADEIVSMTVIGPDVLSADVYATAAFAMGTNGIYFLESLPGFEGYMIDKKGMATFTSDFQKFEVAQ